MEQLFFSFAVVFGRIGQMKKGQNIIGAQVRSKRMEKKLSQNKLAVSCQIQGWQLSRETLSKIEAGLRCVTDAELMLLAQVLGCPAQDLMVATHDELIAAVRHSRDKGQDD